MEAGKVGGVRRSPDVDGRRIWIDGVEVSDASDCFVIAEVGHNHQGSLAQAFELVDAAHKAGANAVKLQKRDNATLYTRELLEQPYENENSFGKTYGAHREALELGRSEYLELMSFAEQLGITFLATAFDVASAEFLAELDLPAYKIASGDIRNTPLLRHVAQIGKPVIFSTGHATLDDVRRAYETVAEINPQVAILQCTAGYPSNWDELDLRVIETYRESFPNAVIGFSGHDNGIAISVAAFVVGARIVEKHFTLNRAMRGTDHAFSLEPQGLGKLVRDLRRTRVALGRREKTIYESEAAPARKMAKKIVANADLPAGHVLTLADLALKSPGDGLPPYELQRVVNCRLLEPLKQDQAVTLELLEHDGGAGVNGGFGGGVPLETQQPDGTTVSA